MSKVVRWLFLAAVLAGIAFVVADLGRDYPQSLTSAWCRHAQALRSAKMLERAYIAYQGLERDRGACSSRAALRELNDALERRAALIEGARAFRRAADLSGRPGQELGRREALRRAFDAYQSALAIDPFAGGARKAFADLVATYRQIDPLEPDCSRARDVADAGLVPEARLYLSRGLRSQQGRICSAGLNYLARERVIADRELRVAKAREATRDKKLARAAYARVLVHDSSEKAALDGLARVEPRALRKEADWADNFAGFFGDVRAVVPTAVWAFLSWLAGGLLLVAIVWRAARAAAGRWRWASNFVDRVPGLREAPKIHLPTEGTTQLTPNIGAMIDDTLARLRAPSIDPRTGRPRAATLATPKGAPAQVEGLFTAVEPLALAAQVLRLGTSMLRTTSDLGLVLEHASGDGMLEQRWRVIDRRTRRTVTRLQVSQDDLPFLPEELDKRLEFFIIRAGEELRATIQRAESLR